MSRVPVDITIRSKAGRVQANVDLNIYERGTTTPVTVYALESGGGTLTQPLTTNDEGQVEAWVDPGSYDLYSPDDDVEPTRSWEAIYAFDIVGLDLVREEPVRVKDPDYGAEGDGIEDDTASIVSAIATGRDIDLGGPDDTYLVSAKLELQPGQKVLGRGATLKRANQVHTTTTSAITSGVTTQITVASATGLAVGKEIVLEKSGTYDTSSRRITNIAGNVVTVSTAFGITSASGTVQVYTTHFVFIGTDDNHIYDVRIDGNKANYTFARWENTCELELQGDRALVSGCYLHDSPGDSIIAFGDYTTVRDTIVKDTNGNGVHFGESSHILVDGVRVENANLDPTVGHADGGIIWSNTISDCTVVNCYVENAICGIGSIDSDDNSDVTIIGNTIRDCTSTAIEGTFPEDNKAENIVIVGNRIYDSVQVSINQVSGATSEFPEAFIFADNLLVNTKLGIVRAHDIVIRGNIFRDAGDTSSIEVTVADCKRVLIEGNHITGGNTAFEVSGTATEHLTIRGNYMLNQNAFGINQTDADLIGVAFDNNHIVNDSTADNAYEGIRVRGLARAMGNFIVLNKGSKGILALDDSIVKDNIVRHGTATYSIFCFGGSTGIIFKDNETTTAIQDNGDGLNTTGNIVIP